MIRKVLALGLCSGMALSLSAQTAFIVKGHLKDTSRNGEKVTLSYFDGVKKVNKPAIISNGAFVIEGTVMEPSIATLSINKTMEERKLDPWVLNDKTEFFIEGGQITVEGIPFSKAKVRSAGRSQQDYLSLQKMLKPYRERESTAWNKMMEAAVKRDTAGSKRYNALHAAARNQIDSMELVYLKKHPQSYVSLNILREKVTTKTLAEDKEKYAALLKPLADSLKQTIVGRKLSQQIANAFKLAPGQDAIDFVLNDTLGNPVRLSSFRGKYVLLDFWASWCIPCRYENPSIKKAYEKFKDKNFTVLGVAFEKAGDRKAWVDAINKDGLPWNHVTCMGQEQTEKFWTMYNIQSIPMNYLIDPNGKIVAVYLRGEALQKKLEEIL